MELVPWADGILDPFETQPIEKEPAHVGIQQLLNKYDDIHIIAIG